MEGGCLWKRYGRQTPHAHAARTRYPEGVFIAGVNYVTDGGRAEGGECGDDLIGRGGGRTVWQAVFSGPMHDVRNAILLLSRLFDCDIDRRCGMYSMTETLEELITRTFYK